MNKKVVPSRPYIHITYVSHGVFILQKNSFNDVCPLNWQNQDFIQNICWIRNQSEVKFNKEESATKIIEYKKMLLVLYRHFSLIIKKLIVNTIYIDVRFLRIVWFSY